MDRPGRGAGGRRAGLSRGTPPSAGNALRSRPSSGVAPRASRSRVTGGRTDRDGAEPPRAMGTAARDPGPGNELDFPVEEWNAAADAAERRRAERRAQRRRRARRPTKRDGTSILATTAGRALAGCAAALFVATVLGHVLLWPGTLISRIPPDALTDGHAHAH